MNSSNLFFPLGALVNVITSITLGFFVYTRNKTDIKNITYGLFCLSITIWSSFYFMWQVATTANAALFYSRAFMMSAIFIPIFYLHHILSLLNLRAEKKHIIKLAYLCGIVFIGFALTPYYITDITPQMFFKFWPKAGFLFSIFLPIWFLIVLYGVHVILHAYKNSNGLSRSRLRYILIATVVGWGGGATNYPLWYGVPILPVGNILVSGYIIITTYAIVRHQLMDIKVVIKKTLIFASLFTIVLGIFVGITILTQEIIAGGRLLGLGISTIIIIFAVRPLEDFLIKITDKYLFQKKYEYKQILKSFLDEVITVLDLDKIVRGTIEFLDKMLHPEISAILLLSDVKDKYVSYGKSGYDKDVFLENKSRVITYLKTKKAILSVEKENPEKLHKDLCCEMRDLSASLAIPLIAADELIGFILLGKKRSDEQYTDEDLSILMDLARTEAITISNSRTLTQLLKAQEKEHQTEHMMSMAYMVTNLSHEIRNPLNIIKTAADAAIQGIEFDSKTLDSDEKHKQLLAYLEKKFISISKTSDKSTSMLNTILNSMRIDKSKFSFVDICQTVTEVIKRSEPELSGTNVIIQNNVSENLLKIKGDLVTFEQALFNLIHNAIQAILRSQKGDKVVVSAKESSNTIDIEILDNGPGIAKDDIPRVFDPFYTTKDNIFRYSTGKSKGAGLGLMLVQQIIGAHEGEVFVESEEGKYAKFTIKVPKEGGSYE